MQRKSTARHFQAHQPSLWIPLWIPQLSSALHDHVPLRPHVHHAVHALHGFLPYGHHVPQARDNHVPHDLDQNGRLCRGS